MTNQEKATLQSIKNRINRLASLEDSCFSMNKEKDKEIKDAIRPYMTWFELCALYIEDTIELSEEKAPKWYKTEQFEKIQYYCK